MNWYLIAAAVIWVTCGTLAYAITFADLQRGYPTLADEDYRENVALSAFFGLLGVLGLLMALLITGFARYGLKFR